MAVINWTQYQLAIESTLAEWPYAAISEIMGFIKELGFQATPYTTFPAKQPIGLYLVNSDQLFITQNNKVTASSTLDGKMVEESLFGILAPMSLDFDLKKNLIYAIDQTHVNIFKLPSREAAGSWTLPQPAVTNQLGRSLKLDQTNNLVYITMWGYNQIFVCDQTNGAVKNKFGTVVDGKKLGEFKNPSGIALDNNGKLYVCDPFNSRVQILDKKTGTAQRQFGPPFLYHPYGVYYDGEDFLFVGDHYRVSIFSMTGELLQRIGGSAYGQDPGKFSLVQGMLVVNDELYVSDRNNNRIQVFRRIVPETPTF